MRTRPRPGRLWGISVAWLVLTASVCQSTTIVAMRTPEVIAIAADTEVTFRGGGQPDARASVSKIFQQGQVLYAISGFARDPSGIFDVASTIAAAFHETQPFWHAVAHIEAQLSHTLTRALLYLRRYEPGLFRQEITEGKGGTTVLLASLEHGVPVAMSLYLRGAMNDRGHLHILTRRRTCPGEDCPEGRYTFLLGRHQAIEQYFTTNSTRLAMRPEDAVSFMVQLEIDARTPGVGPPIEVVRLSKYGIHWLARMGTRHP